VKFDDDRLFIEAVFPVATPLPEFKGPGMVPGEGPPAKPGGSLLIDADYAMNKEGVVFGVVTGIESDWQDGMVAGLERFVGEPFAFRLRQDEQAMSTRELRFGGSGLAGPGDRGVQLLNALIVGRFYPAGPDGKTPTARRLTKPRLNLAGGGGMIPPAERSLVPSQTIPPPVPAGGGEELIIPDFPAPEPKRATPERNPGPNVPGKTT
jgi:hypothetical protein